MSGRVVKNVDGVRTPTIEISVTSCAPVWVAAGSDIQTHDPRSWKEVCRCPERTCLTGKLGLIRQDGLRIRLHCRVHPEIYGEWYSDAEMDEEKLALAGRLRLK